MMSALEGEAISRSKPLPYLLFAQIHLGGTSMPIIKTSPVPTGATRVTRSAHTMPHFPSYNPMAKDSGSTHPRGNKEQLG